MALVYWRNPLAINRVKWPLGEEPSGQGKSTHKCANKNKTLQGGQLQNGNLTYKLIYSHVFGRWHNGPEQGDLSKESPFGKGMLFLKGFFE